MFKKLTKRSNDPIQVGLVGAGAMGKGIAWQVSHTVGMAVTFITDLNLEAARATALEIGLDPIEVGSGEVTAPAPGQVLIGTDTLALLAHSKALGLSTFVEATNAIADACDYCLAAIDQNLHVVLMNAEVDLVYGQLLAHEAEKKGVVVTSDAGDQHGVLMTMIDEIRLWGFDIVQAGNMKGFLDRDATPESIRVEAEKRNLSPVQCCAYTDGTKLNIEMALLCNALNLSPKIDGMEGPRCKDVTEVLELFDFDSYDGKGRVDYVLGAQPGGGVYVVGSCDDKFQHPYLDYYKVLSKGRYYLFYRPYHLCHLETTTAIAKAALYGEAVLTQDYGRVADVYAYAKSDLSAGQAVQHGIGGAECYGLIRTCADAEKDGHLAISHLEGEADKLPVLKRDIAKGQPVLVDDVELPDIAFHRLLARQAALG